MINRRADPRHAITLKALVHPAQGRSWLGTIRDFCRGGMLLVSEGVRSLEASGSNPQREDAVDIHFTVPTVDGDRHFRLQASVARVTSDGKGMGVFYPNGMDQLALKSLNEYAAATGGGPKDEGRPQGARMDGAGELKIDPHDAAHVLGELKSIVGAALPRLAKIFFEGADKNLLVRARDASSPPEQTRFFQAMNELERKRAEVEASFARAVMDQLENPLDANVSMERRRGGNMGSGGGGLALVDTAQFEAWLALAEIISKVETRFEHELLEIREQLGCIVRAWRHKESLPVGPATLARVFDEVFRGVQVDQEIRQLLYRTFQDGLMPQLKNLYGAINKMLADSNLFPPLDELLARHPSPAPVISQGTDSARDETPPPTSSEPLPESEVRAPSATFARAPSDARLEPIGPGRRTTAASFYAGGPAAPTVDVFEAATTLLNLQRQSRRGLGGSRSGREPSPNTYTTAQVVDGLRELERELGGAPLETSQIRDRLLSVLRARGRGAEGKRIGDSQADAMDVVGSLVASIREDNLLTEGVKDWIKRLELTLNKLATQDPEFLKTQSKRPHAAMQVINQLAKLGNAGDEGEGIDGEVGREVDSLMERVIREFDANPRIFDEALENLNPLVDRQTRTYQGNIQRTVRASEGQQRLSRARRDVVDVVQQRLAGREVPVLILDLLNPGWRNLLVHHHLRHGRDSEQWKENLQLLEQLYGQLSGTIAAGSAEYVEPAELLVAVDEALSSISFEPGRRTPLLRRLSRALRGEGEEDAVVLAANDSAKAVGLEEAVPETDPAPERADPASQREWRQWLDRGRKLKVGDWVAVSDDSGARRAILSVAWIGEDHASFVLVNRKGIKVRELNLRELVQSLMDGRILILDEFDLPLLERASHRMLQNMHNQLAYQASHDELTGLINRKEFENRLEKAIVTAHTEDQHHVVLYADLDQFKIINNTAGHSAGDELLKVLARKLRHELRGVRGTLARLGGDEFGALLEQVPADKGVEIAQRQLDAIRNYRFDWEERHFSLSASVGVVNVDESVKDVNELMRSADAACYAAKDAGRDRVQLFAPADSKLARRTGVMEWVTQIDRALDENRLLLNCQRIVPIAADKPMQFEFLLTMLDQDGHVLAPAEFIHAAETYNRMTAIDRWVIRNALEWMASRGDEINGVGHFSINLSGHSLNDEGFSDYVLEQLTKSSVRTAKICFEITETAAITNLDQAIEFMNKMKIIGCHFALDDFGTGLSSYSYLRNLPVDYLKIDGVFVKDLDRSPGDFAVVKSINEIGHVMGKQTIAEFVENDDILERLREIGVDYGQGFGIEKPHPISEFKL